jgi:ABC-type dipeptide/oligopeptide/nickel transport system permease subunit
MIDFPDVLLIIALTHIFLQNIIVLIKIIVLLQSVFFREY